MSTLGVGFDLVEFREVAEALDDHGQRYLQRIFTPAERERCGQHVPQLAVHFAAKEAVLKALGRSGDPVPWTSIELLRSGQAGPVGRTLERARIALTGQAAALADSRGAVGLEVAVALNQSHAAAIVIAVDSSD